MQYTTEQGIKLYGFYRGQVIQHLESGKCKIFIPGVFPEEFSSDPKNLPEAEQAAPLFGGTNKGNGMFSYPNIGTIVWCFFQNGDQNYPVYFAATLGGEMAVDAPGEGFMEIRDNVSEDDDNPEEDTTRTGEDSQQHMINCGSSRIVIRESGQVIITTREEPDDEEGTPGENMSQITMDGDGSIEIYTTQQISISSPQILIEAEDQLEMNTKTLKIKASDQMSIITPKFSQNSSNSYTVSSPAIKMDATRGMFMAQGKDNLPFVIR